MKKSLYFAPMILGTVLLLSGCASAPTVLGVTDTEWSDYSQDQQEKLLTDYEKITKERKHILKKQKGEEQKGTFLSIKIHDGQVMMPPFSEWQNYKPVHFEVFKERCRDVTLQQSDDENIQTTLGVCFRGNTLYLDHSHYDLAKKNGSISINSSPLWLSGFSYKGISSSGYVRLNNATVEIKQEEK